MNIIGGNLDMWGLIPSFLNEASDAPTIKQLDAGQPGGWRKFDGFTFDAKHEILSYPGDPPMKAMSKILFNNDIIMLFPHAWVLVLNADNRWEVARMD